MITQHAQRGFSLIEITLYVALVGIILLIVSQLITVFIQNSIKQESIFAVESQSQFAMAHVLQVIRDSDQVIVQQSGSRLQYRRQDVIGSPSFIEIDNGSIAITHQGQFTPLTSDTITVSNLLFEHIVIGSEPGSVRVTFEAERNSSSQRSEFDYDRTFIGTATLRVD